MTLPARLHMPGERRIVTFDFTEKLRTGATLSGTATVTVDPGITVGLVNSDLDHGLVDVTLSGGVDGENYSVFCEHETSDGEILIMAMIVEVRSLDE